MTDHITVTKRFPRALRTPTDEAFYIIASISEYFQRKLPEMPEEAFHKGILLVGMNKAFPGGDAAMEEIRSAFAEHPEESDQLAGIFMMMLAVYYACDAIKAEKAGSVTVAWTMISDAQYWRGLVLAEPPEDSSVKSNARKAARASHKENTELRADLFAWCEKNFDNYPSIAKAAEASMKVVPMAYRTLYGWITLWHNMKLSEK